MIIDLIITLKVLEQLIVIHIKKIILSQIKKITFKLYLNTKKVNHSKKKLNPLDKRLIIIIFYFLWVNI